MQGSQDRVAECTTSNFDGMISMLRPEQSWVAKWQRIGECRRSQWMQYESWMCKETDCITSLAVC